MTGFDPTSTAERTGSEPRRGFPAAPLVAAGALLLLLLGCDPSAPRGDPRLLHVIGGPGHGPGHFSTPRGASIAGDTLFVVDRSGRIQVLDLDGRLLRTVRILDEEARTGHPIGILAAPDGGLVLCDTHKSAVRFFDKDLKVAFVLGAEGKEPGDFTYPQRAAWDADGNLYVTEYGDGPSNRVQVFDQEHRFLRQFGGYGFEDGKFTRPMGIDVSGDEVFVSDASNRIIVYRTDGTFLREFGSEGGGVGEMKYPYGLCVVGDYVYVAEYGNHRVSRFHKDGRAGGCFGRLGWDVGEFQQPWDVTADDRGRLFVCDTGNHRVVRFDPNEVAWFRGGD